MTVKFKYVGRGGEFLHGIPARDLSENDWAGLTPEQQGMVTVSQLYKAEAKSIKAEAKAKEDSHGG